MGQLSHIAVTNRHVVLADWLFTTPTVIFQPLSGLVDDPSTRVATEYPLGRRQASASTPWPAPAGCPWSWLQIRMSDLAASTLANHAELPPAYWRMARAWFWLGVPAFCAMVMVVALMVFKHIPGAFQ